MRGLFVWRGGTAARTGGFALAELLAVIGVTAVMGALAMSVYRTYSVRAQIAAGIADAREAQGRVVNAFRRDGTPPADRLAAGLTPNAQEATAEYVESIEIVDGRIDLRFGRNADEAITGNVLSLTPFETAEQNVVWVCGNRPPGVGLKPLGFMSGSRQASQVLTAIDPRFLPSACR